MLNRQPAVETGKAGLLNTFMLDSEGKPVLRNSCVALELNP
jgi:hypothetical protein